MVPPRVVICRPFDACQGDALLNLLLACCYAHSIQRKGNTSETRHDYAVHAFTFAERYAALSAPACARDVCVAAEVNFNVGRLAQLLMIPTTAVEAYQRVLSLRVASDDSERRVWLDGIQKAARHGLGLLLHDTEVFGGAPSVAV